MTRKLQRYLCLIPLFLVDVVLADAVRQLWR